MAPTLAEHRTLVAPDLRGYGDVTGRGLRCGHFIAEEAPAELLELMVPFLAGQSVPEAARSQQ